MGLPAESLGGLLCDLFDPTGYKDIREGHMGGNLLMCQLLHFLFTLKKV